MKQAMAALLCLIAATPAVAEVCDKVRPAWTPQDGPVGQFEDLVWFLSEPVGLLAMGLTAGALLLGSAWVSAITIVILMPMAALYLFTWLKPDDIISFAIDEGCMTAPVFPTIALIAMAASIVALTWVRPLRNAKSP